MAVNATHPDYDAAAAEWARARDVLAGEDAVKAGGEKYLARLDSQTDEEFAAYVQRASFFNATARTPDFVTIRSPAMLPPNLGQSIPLISHRHNHLETVSVRPAAPAIPRGAQGKRERKQFI